MGYYPSDMMGEYLSETTHLFYDGEWGFEEEGYNDEDMESVLSELPYDPAEKADEIKAAGLEEAYVFHSGEFFQDTIVAYMFQEERETLEHILRDAFDAGRDNDRYHFNEWFKKDFCHAA